jgi:transposase-like protein
MAATIAKGCVQNAEDAAYLELIMNERWPAGKKKCAKCREFSNHVRMPGRTAYACQSCHHHIYPLAGTIFEGSTTRLSHWFKAAYLYSSDFRIPATFIEHELDVTYKTAWRILSRIHCLGLDAWIMESDDDSRERADSHFVRAIVTHTVRKGPRAVAARSRMRQNANVTANEAVNGKTKAVKRNFSATPRQSRRNVIDGDKVYQLAKLGFTVQIIARLLNCERHALLKYYRREITEGRLAGKVTGRRGRRMYAIRRRRGPSRLMSTEELLEDIGRNGGKDLLEDLRPFDLNEFLFGKSGVEKPSDLLESLRPNAAKRLLEPETDEDET